MPTSSRHPCPCCGALRLNSPGSYEICDVCGWEDDPVQAKDPDFAGGANSLSLNEFRKTWQAARPAAKRTRAGKSGVKSSKSSKNSKSRKSSKNE